MALYYNIIYISTRAYYWHIILKKKSFFINVEVKTLTTMGTRARRGNRVVECVSTFYLFIFFCVFVIVIAFAKCAVRAYI